MDNVQNFYHAWSLKGISYGGKSLEVCHEPYLIEEKDALSFKKDLEILHSTVEKVTTLFIKGEFRELYSFDSRLMDLILAHPGYSVSCPLTRWDSFWDGENLKLLELNTDGTSGMAYVEALNRIYIESFPGEERVYSSLRKRVLDTLLDCYHEFSKRRVEVPQIAIVDWKDVATRPEQIDLAHYFNQMGISTVLADPRELRYDGTFLWKDDFRIDLIYRRVVTREYLEAWDKVKPMTKAYFDQNVCVVGSFRSQIGFDKRTFTILSSPEFEIFFTPQENQLKSFLIPWTRSLQRTKTEFHRALIEIPQYVIDNPSLFVLKPPSLNRGRGVLMGSDIDHDQWKEEVIRRLNGGDIVQEKLQVPLRKGVGIHLGHFVFGGKLAGWMCRMGRDAVLGDFSDDYLVPCLIHQVLDPVL
ncbi:MAG: hypothetical protein HYS07_08175 [Chlamydiae bacterium]|nr:hypothetical protein [Chlamydiota bacterium]MBI3276762.1 hypothetical protein [Chlamydiota bacterium]